ncbi:MAG TPA: hypothetical protein VIU11_16790 [Nakamurella sp.]
MARDLVTADRKTRVWVRRLYTDATTGELAGADARKRDFPQVARAFLTARDQICARPIAAPRSGTPTTLSRSPRVVSATCATATAAAPGAT